MSTLPKPCLVLLLGCISIVSHAQITELKLGAPLQFIADLPKAIPEASGLQMSSSKILWTFNDGGVPVLYGLDTTGALVKTIYLNHTNNGWEDLARDDNGNFFLGNFGNNTNKRKDLKVYSLGDPEAVTAKIYNAELIKFRYSDQKKFPPSESVMNFDMDAFISWDNALYMFSKNRTKPFTGYTKIYTLPAKPGEYVATLVDSIFLGNKGHAMNYWVTSADVSPDKKTIVLLSHDKMWLIRNPRKGKPLSTSKIYLVPLNNFSHKAGVCFSGNSKLYIVDELEMGLIGGKLYSLDLSSTLQSIDH